MTETKPTIAVIGGTGALGSGLALRWAKAGYDVIIGSRSQDNADRAASDLSERAGATVRGLENGAAAAAADMSVLTVPFANHQPMIDAIRDGSRAEGLACRPDRQFGGRGGADLGADLPEPG
jgi:NADPH-dependent F420 reductase